MKPRNHRRAIVAFFCYLAALLSLPAPTPARAEDIDIFLINPVVSGLRPNVLIILDTSSNWASTDTVYATATGTSQPKFINVRSALSQVLSGFTQCEDPILVGPTGLPQINTPGCVNIFHPGLDDRFNVGLMFYAETGGGNDNIDGGYLRKGVRQLTPANKAAFIDFFNHVDGNFDKSNNTSMGLAFYEAFRYFTGQSGYAGIGKVKRDYPHNLSVPAGCPAAPENANSNCTNPYSNALYNLALEATENPPPKNALTDAAATVYNSPISDHCQKNYIIYVANGVVTDSNSVNTDATTKLAAAGGDTTAITIGADDGNQSNISDEWTRFLANRPDVTDSTVLGAQKIITYTVEVNPTSNQQGRANTALLKSMGERNGNGGYVGVTTAGGGAALAAELLNTFAKIKAVNSVFAASTLPVSVNVRGSFLNQVYMGVFRPDANSSPRWPGNVKQYKLNATGTVGGGTTVFLADVNGAAIENPTTGFVVPTAISFWSSASTFWNTTYYPNVKTDIVAATATDSPDGEFVEKGGAAQRLRDTYPGPTAPDISQRKLYTCLAASGCTNGTALGPISTTSAHEFVDTNANITNTALQISGPQPIIAPGIQHTVGQAFATVNVANHGFATASVVAIAGATQGQYNGNFNITVTGANTFTIPVTESPVTPATGTITASKGTGTAVGITSMTHGAGAGTPPLVTVTVTTAANHLFANNQQITITGATQTEYNGIHTISTSGGNTFTFTLPETPDTPASLAGNAKASGKNINSITRTGTSALVTTQNNHGFSVGTSVTITGVNTAGYNGTFNVVTVPSTTTFTYTVTVGPATPATTSTSMTADPGTVLSVTSITRSGTTATVTTSTDPTAPPASFANGNPITISGATQPEYNGTFNIANINAGARTFQYTVSVNPTTEATAGMTATGSGGVTKSELVNWVRGANIQLDDNPNVTPTASAARVRGYLHGDVLHSRPAVINYNRASQPANRDLIVYYGANDGIIHAVKGGQDPTDGFAKWGFIPSEFFDKFVRLYLQSPVITPTTTRSYFADGPISVNAVYVSDTSVTPPQDRMEGAGARAQIYIGMRRGGRFYYSLDVTDPDAPRYLWKIDNTMPDFAELGQSWSEMKVVKVKITPTSGCPGGADSQGNCKVLVFGAGYDAAKNDVEPQQPATMGRGIFIVDAITGQHIWSASPTTFVPTNGVHKQVAGMTFSIAADMAVINSDGDVQNLADRIYAVDTGGNIWRVNISDPDPSNWNVGQLASLSGTLPADKRRFLFAPDVVAFDPPNTTIDSVLVGSGDREHPFDVTIANRFYMIKDSHALTALPATVVTEADLVDLTSNTLQDPTATQATLDGINQDLVDKSGWFIALASGEKTVTGSTTLGGTTIFATNRPTSALGTGSCAGPLGQALIYAVDFKNATATLYFDTTPQLSHGRAEERVGGGLPPTPIPFSTQIGSNFYEGAITGTQIVQPPSSPVGQRYRVFWNLSVDN